MIRLREWLVRLWSSLGTPRPDADLEDELRLHVELAREAQQRRGATSDEAARAVALRHGPDTQAMDALRDQRGLPWLEDVVQDVRYGLRGASRSPLFAGVIVLSLAIGIGANSAIFSVVEATLLRELPVAQPEELVQLRWRSRTSSPPGPAFAAGAFDVFRDRATTLSDVFAYDAIREVGAVIDRQPAGATMQMVSGNFFQGLGVSPAIGRLLTDDDAQVAVQPAAVISHRFWVRRFEQSARAVGAKVSLDGVAFTIVGVASEALKESVSRARTSDVWLGKDPAPDFWVPIAAETLFATSRPGNGRRWLSVMGRMVPGATTDQVRANLEGPLSGFVLDQGPLRPGGIVQMEVVSARRGAPEADRDSDLDELLMLAVISSIVLLVVCLNVANLLVSRSGSRRLEIGVRLALGASRRRLIRQLLTEHMALALIGGGLGLLWAYWGRWLFAATALVSAELDLRIDARVLGATVLLSVVTGLLFGLVPAVRATRVHQGATTERVEVSGPPASLLNRVLLVAQVAVAVVLLVGAGLFTRSLGGWADVDAGFDPSDLLVFQIEPGRLSADEAQAAIIMERILERIHAVPGVRAVSQSGSFWEDRPPMQVDLVGDDRGSVAAGGLPVRHDFLETVGLPLIAGRGFLEEDHYGSPRVAIIDAALAEKLTGRSPPLGRRITLRRFGPELEIVGVVRNLWRSGTPFEREQPTIYLPYAPSTAGGQAASIAARTTRPPLLLLPEIRRAVATVAPELPLLEPGTVEQGMADRLGPAQVTSLIWLSFGAVALTLTAVGLYGIMAGNVARRTREIGIRTALGADRVQIVRLVTLDTAALVAIGLLVGAIGSLQVNQVLRALIFGVRPDDVLTIAGVVSLVVLVSAMAAFVPARRAVSVDPTVALRLE